jgi:hypothetical protein
MPNSEPTPKHPDRRIEALRRRNDAAKIHHDDGLPHVDTVPNTDEERFDGEGFPSNFTKGLRHAANGTVAANADYEAFKTAVNRASPNGDDEGDLRAFNDVPIFDGPFSSIRTDGGAITWRGWESPRAGHYFDLQGPDADEVGMAPAPELGSAELTAEMAEVYAMALLRDVPFSAIQNETGQDPATGISVNQVLDAMNSIDFFTDGGAAPTAFAKRRQAARLLDPSDYNVTTGAAATLPPFNGVNLFRGSGPGAKVGPWVSQFMLVGNVMADRDASEGGGIGESYVSYGTQLIDQKSRTFARGLDFMTNWAEWLDVQNGADFRGFNTLTGRRFLATPRDMAAYVRFDALYQAYLNACLLLLGAGADFQDGFPDSVRRMDDGNEFRRTGFASFGGPHVLSLVTEVATRCLKFARRQKFNWHRRARPEKISGLLTLAKLHGTAGAPTLGNLTKGAAQQMLQDLGPLGDLVHAHNQHREAANAGHRGFAGAQPDWLGNSSDGNLLLAMAFPEGSPMHPAYAAGHATVAGGCVTMLKAFFKTLKTDDCSPLPWSETRFPVVQANEDGSALNRLAGDLAEQMTIEGELNKLAANISIARNMAGVHYYSDYYDSLRMGERVAVGILVEQMTDYDEPVTMTFRSFDGDTIVLSSTENDVFTAPDGTGITYHDWLHRPQTDVPVGTGV